MDTAARRGGLPVPEGVRKRRARGIRGVSEVSGASCERRAERADDAGQRSQPSAAGRFSVDALCKQQTLSPEQRLLVYQRDSQPVMELGTPRASATRSLRSSTQPHRLRAPGLRVSKAHP
jgi:hypothetical protein